MTTDYRHPDYERMAPLWTKVRDACAGEDAIKAKSTVYLPDPSEGMERDRDYQRARYAAYLQRATYFNATGRTLNALVGIAYANWPQFKLSPRYDYLLRDADMSGVGLINQSQGVLAEILQTGRAGLLTDATAMDETAMQRTMSIAEWEALGGRNVVVAYKADQILTWELDGSRLVRLVLLETHLDYSSGEVDEVRQLRELTMRDGRCHVALWREVDSGKFVKVMDKPTSFEEIPFQFVGAVNNSAHPDQPPLLDLANLNLAHYRNSADFEESAFLTGQPQMVMSGVDEEWMEKAGRVYLGARSALPLPQGATAQLLQAQPNTLAQTAMEKKEEMMAALGARLLAQTGQPMTATQSAAETKTSYSALSLACDNLSEAYTRALQVLDPNADFAIDTRFNDLMLDAEAIRETVAAWQAGLVPASDAWNVLRRLGVVDQGKTDEELRDELDAQGPRLDLDDVA